MQETEIDPNIAEEILINSLYQDFEKAIHRRQAWEGHWDDCYAYALPHKKQDMGIGARANQTLYDSTAMNAVDRLASSLLSELTPPWSRWFRIAPGDEFTLQEKQHLAPIFEETTKILQDHFQRSNFSVEIHQAFLDLVTAGTASILFEEAKPGSFSIFQFKAVPLQESYLLEDQTGKLTTTYRKIQLNARALLSLCPTFFNDRKTPHTDDDTLYDLLEIIKPDDHGFCYYLILDEGDEKKMIKKGHYTESPYIHFRWSKAPNETYGRSPIMRCLPDIKTANKVVELVLKNASIAVTGIWQADDDGVLNPANIKLTPGTIIPKAVGSAGLKPLEMPGKFDLSQLVLEDLRARIKEALMADDIDQGAARSMTATEYLNRSDKIVRLLGATYGRLQSELLTPLIKRAYEILRRRGEIADIDLDGRQAIVTYTSPIAKAQAQRDMQQVVGWIEQATRLGPDAAALVNFQEAARFIGQTLGVPSTLMREVPVIEPITDVIDSDMEGENV